MNVTPASARTRHVTRTVLVGDVAIGSAHPIVVQSMTNTDTADAVGTATQVAELAAAGSELVRITVNTRAAAAAVPEVVLRAADLGSTAPIIGDFHFNGHVLLTEFAECARSLAKFRINPGNIGRGERNDENFETLIRCAMEYGKPVRIGVNWGSIDQELLTLRMDENAARPEPVEAREVFLSVMVESALVSSEKAHALGLAEDQVILSVKMSRLPDLVEVYRRLAQRSSAPLHLGLTEAGMGMKGAVNTAAALGVLLEEGIGDTIRASLTPRPGGDRCEEVRLCRQILQALELRRFVPDVTACPGCGRTTSTLFQSLAEDIQSHLDQRMVEWRARYPGAEDLRVAVMGCIVNGPGESKHADVGISLPGTGESPKAPVFVDGVKAMTLEGETIAGDFIRLLDEYVESRWGQAPRPAGERVSR